MKKFVVSVETTLQNFTDNVYAQASFCYRTLLKNRDVRVNGAKVGVNVALKRGDEVCYYLTAAQEAKKAFETVYEDENIVVVDKESGVNSEAVFSALSERGETYFIHRLDRNTQGLLVFAKTKRAEEELLRAFREKKAEKIYLALVVGQPPEKRAVLRAYLQKDEKTARVRISEKAVGEKIVTEYEVLEARGETSLLKIILHTGKTHQIRAHLAYLGCPVVGDAKYGDDDFNRSHHVSRQKLLAKELCLQCGGELSYLCGKRFRSEREL